MVGRIKAPSLPSQDTHLNPWNLRTLYLTSQKEFAEVIKLKLISSEDFPEFLARPNVITRILINKRGNRPESRRDLKMLSGTSKTEGGAASQGGR